MKKRTSKLVSTLLVLCMVLSLLPGMALADDTDFEIENSILAKYNGSGGEVTIPDGVTVIGDGVFAGCTSLTSVTIPAGVTTIGVAAFDGCENLVSVTIPASVTMICDSAFGCEKLTDVYYGGSSEQWEKIDVDMHNGMLLSATIHYDSVGPDTPDTPDTPDVPSFKIELSAQNLTVDAKENVECEKYNIDGNNYFKLRDLAALLDGTGSQFEVTYDDASKTILVTTGKAYTRVGGELEIRGDMSSKAEVSAQALQIDGVTYDTLKVYNIGGNNFFQLRQLGDILGFDVDYDPAGTGTAIVKSR